MINITMKVVTTHSDTIDPELYNKAVSFVQDLAKDNDNKIRTLALVNMGLESSSGLLWNIANKARWTKEQGEIALLFSDTDEIVGVSCVERSIKTGISIGGIRTWVLPEYRNKNVVTNMLLNSNLEWSTANDMYGMLLTFNSYNKWIYTGIKRKANGQGAGLAKIWSDWWNDCIIIDRPLKIRYVDQWCVAKPTGKCEPSVLKTMLDEIDDLSV
jgi:hypothetical protein